MLNLCMFTQTSKWAVLLAELSRCFQQEFNEEMLVVDLISHHGDVSLSVMENSDHCQPDTDE